MWLKARDVQMPVLQPLGFLTDEEGTTALDYGLLAALISAVIITAVNNLSLSVIRTLTSITAAMLAIIGVGS